MVAFLGTAFLTLNGTADATDAWNMPTTNHHEGRQRKDEEENGMEEVTSAY